MAHALVVDDSRTARAVLKHMLSKESYEIHALESAEDALDYLATGKTDVIFMDHLMPGMDGFAAVKQLKSREATRHIPIVMYTSKEGEVYKGQAHALGAAAILNKPASQQQLQAVLDQVAAWVVEQANKEEARASEALQEQTEVEALLREKPHSEKLETEAVIAESGGGLHLVDAVNEPGEPPKEAANSDAQAPASAADEVAAIAPAVQKSDTGERVWKWASLLALTSAVLFAILYVKAQQQINLQAEHSARLLNALLRVSNQAATVDSAEVAMGGQRTEILRQLLDGAAAAGFNGTILVRSHLGQFCRVQSASGELTVAPDSLPIADCASVGLNEQAAEQISTRQTRRFKDLLKRSPALQSGAITVQTEAVGAAEPKTEYPDVQYVHTAGDWNSVARQNNRVEFRLLPARER